MRYTVMIMILALTGFTALAQDKKLYDPTANAAMDITAAVKKAAAENKYVLIQAVETGVAGVLNLLVLQRPIVKLIQ